MANKKWIIVEYDTDLRCFSPETFKSYEDGWNYLYVKFPATKDDDNEDMLDLYTVIPIDNPHYELSENGSWILKNPK